MDSVNGFKYDPNQEHQLEAIGSVVSLFDGQPADAATMMTNLMSMRENQISLDLEDQFQLVLDLQDEVGAIGNHLLLDKGTILQNLQAVQDRNGLEVSEELVDDSLDFDIEMETGTGKTYVYLRTIFELAKNYGFRKFIILVPSVAIKEGVATSVEQMAGHFKELYSTPFDFLIYRGEAAEEVQRFATATSVQIMLTTIQSMRGDKNTRIIHQERDQLNGLKPIDYLKATRPILIMDEPQNMESELSTSAISELNPLCTLRYSATHAKQRNVVYRLDPVDAHDKGLVKQIVVSEVAQAGADPKPYIKLLDVRREPWKAQLELVYRQANGSQKRKKAWIPLDVDLARATKNSIYDGWRITQIWFDPPQIELSAHGILQVGETIGEGTDLIHREMIRETIREHLKKEAELRPRGIKVLSLFFVDKVEHYRTYSDDGTVETDGKFAQWFDEILADELARKPEYRALYPEAPSEVRQAYFAVMRKKGGIEKYVDSSEQSNQRDNEAFNLIMRGKAQLVSFSEPVRFIFSHSALREGWDNPNVFQICVLREMGETLERRQTIGRGLRLPVNQDLERVPDRSIAQLSVIAHESYQAFAAALQDEYARAGVSIGRVRPGEFSKIVTYVDDAEVRLGYRKSKQIWDHLLQAGFIDEEGKVTGLFNPAFKNFTLNLPSQFAAVEGEVVSALERCKIERYVRQARNRRKRKLNEEVYESPMFKDFWDKIARATTYRVSVDRNDIIDKAVVAIQDAEPIKPLRVEVTRAQLKITRGRAEGSALEKRSEAIDEPFELPDILAELQESTSLTRKTLVEILVKSGRLDEFLENPHDFMSMVKEKVKAVLAESIVDGIQYEPINKHLYELRELQEDGALEREHFVDRLYKVQNPDKTDYDQVVFDSGVERKFAELLDMREDVKLFMKLPARFKVPTPVGHYNPDWAIIKQEDGRERLYLIRETKSAPIGSGHRGTEVSKVTCGKKHFQAIGVEDFEISTPENWNI